MKVGFTSLWTGTAGAGGVSYYLPYDGQGNIVQIANRGGLAPYAFFTYDSYGAANRYQGTLSADYASYKGYDYGPAFYKTGVRHYESDSGRFISPDAFKGYMNDPQSQHPYMYCKGNPIKYSDPSGYQSAREQNSSSPEEYRVAPIIGRQADAARNLLKHAEEAAAGTAMNILLIFIPEIRVAKLLREERNIIKGYNTVEEVIAVGKLKPFREIASAGKIRIIDELTGIKGCADASKWKKVGSKAYELEKGLTEFHWFEYDGKFQYRIEDHAVRSLNP